MRTLFAVFFYWLYQISFALWVGGAIVLGAISAPALFSTAKGMGHTHWGMPLYKFAGVAAGVAFKHFNYLVLVAGAVLIVSGLAYGSLAGLCRVRMRVRAVLTAVAWGVSAWLTFSMFPQMEAARNAGQMEVVDALHKTYSGAYWVQIILLLTAAALTGWMHLDLATEHHAAVPLHPETPQPAHAS